MGYVPPPEADKRYVTKTGDSTLTGSLTVDGEIIAINKSTFFSGLDANDARVTGVGTPQGTSDGTPRDYVDTGDAKAVPKALVDAKGDLLVGTANDTVARLAVGTTDGYALTVDAASATVVKWAPVSSNANVVQVANFSDVTVPPPAGTLVILTP